MQQSLHYLHTLAVSLTFWINPFFQGAPLQDELYDVPQGWVYQALNQPLKINTVTWACSTIQPFGYIFNYKIDML